MPIEIASDAEAEDADYVVCAPVGPSPFNDNLTGNCSKCGCEVMFRWYAPQKPPRICIECALKLYGSKDATLAARP